MVSRYLIEAGLMFAIPYALFCYFYTKQYRKNSQKAAVWLFLLVLMLPTYAFWGFLYVIVRIFIDALPGNQ